MVNFYYFDNLLEKTEENLLYYCKKIDPKFTIGELQNFIDEVESQPLKEVIKINGKKLEGFVEIGEDYDTTADLTSLKIEQLKIIYQIFISRELNNRIGVKWRFYQTLKFFQDLIISSIQMNRSIESETLIDLIIEMDDDQYMLVLCFDILDKDKYTNGVKKIEDFSKKYNIIPERIIFAFNKAYRSVPIDTVIKLDDKEVIPELWAEWIEEKCPFNGEDLLIVNNNESEVAGFNFSNTKELLDYLYEFTEGGQISVYKNPGFFSEKETYENKQQLELIWKGIMVKNE